MERIAWPLGDMKFLFCQQIMLNTLLAKLIKGLVSLMALNI